MRGIIALIFLGLVAGAGCAAKPRLLLRFSGGPDEALVHINDRYAGKLGRLEKQGIKLEPGDYRVTIDAVGYFPHDQLVHIGQVAPHTPITVELEPVPD